jgi:MarR-like DNA-binding transcriptional regulator SgrR of sgrS sRNA
LKEKLIKEADLTLAPVLRRAANEAAALAWLTPYPLLLLPELLEEKVAAIRRQAARQADILRRSRTLAEEAA